MIGLNKLIIISLYMNNIEINNKYIDLEIYLKEGGL